MSLNLGDHDSVSPSRGRFKAATFEDLSFNPQALKLEGRVFWEIESDLRMLSLPSPEMLQASTFVNFVGALFKLQS
jgi:hypothetical protein